MIDRATKADLQRLAGLHRAAERRAAGEILLEGPRLLEEALAAGLAPRLVLVADGLEATHGELLEAARGRGARVRLAERERLDGAGATEQGQGLLASASLPPATAPAAASASGAWLELALAGLQDPGNVGTLLRSARAFAARGVHVLAGTADPLAPKALRASAGAALHVPLHAAAGVEALLSRAAQAGLVLVASAARASGTVLRGLPERALLVLGHETRGLPDLPGARVASVPQVAELDSLNVAMAGSILMAGHFASFAAARQ